MKNDPTVQPYLQTLKNNQSRILKTMGTCCMLSLLAFFVLPRSYKVSTQIGLQTQYFQLPLVSGFMPETLDPQEIKAKREGLIREALNQQFLTELATRYQLVKDPTDSYELEQFRKKFEIIPNGASAFIVNFSAKNANLAFQVLQDFLNHLKAVMTNNRRMTLLNLHDAIQEQLESITMSSKQGSNSLFSARPDLIQWEREKVEAEIETLKNAYSEKHPRIAALKDRQTQLEQMERQQAEKRINEAPTVRPDVFSGLQVDSTSKELFDDLLRKYRYLEIVLYMDQQSKDQYLSYLSEPFIPHSPTFPKLPLLLTWGLAMGFFLGAGSVLYRGFRKEIPAGIGNRLSAVRAVFIGKGVRA